MYETAGAGHILDYYRRISRNLFAQVPAYGPTIGIETSAWGKSYEQTKRLSFIESFVASRPANSRDEVTDDQADQ
jgi:hypothetical protein